MALIQCPDCGRDVSTMATACPNCGRPVDHQDKQKSNIITQVSAGKRIACPDGNCTGIIKETCQCGTCGKPHDWVDPDPTGYRAALTSPARQLGGVCPTCGSASISKISTGTKMKYVLAVGILAPAFKKVRSQFLCESCGYKW